MSALAPSTRAETRRRGLPALASTLPAEFQQHPNGDASTTIGLVKYWLAWVQTIDDEVEVVLTAETCGHHRRIARWLHASEAHDRVHTRRLMRKHHAKMLALAQLSRPTRAQRETLEDMI